jgi:hypothetical protein
MLVNETCYPPAPLYSTYACKLFPQRNMPACNVSFSEGKLAFACTQAPKKLLRKGKIWQAYNKLLHSLPLHQKHIPALSKTLGNKTNKIILHLLAQSKTRRGKLHPRRQDQPTKTPYGTHTRHAIKSFTIQDTNLDSKNSHPRKPYRGNYMLACNGSSSGVACVLRCRQACYLALGEA